MKNICIQFLRVHTYHREPNRWKVLIYQALQNLLLGCMFRNCNSLPNGHLCDEKLLLPSIFSCSNATILIHNILTIGVRIGRYHTRNTSYSWLSHCWTCNIVLCLNHEVRAFVSLNLFPKPVTARH